MNDDIGLTNAREKALMEEEKWLIENLRIVRKQRHDLNVSPCIPMMVYSTKQKYFSLFIDVFRTMEIILITVVLKLNT